MKFYKNFKLNSKVKLIAIGICIAIMIFVWAVNYIKINAAFPEAQEVIYTCEEALEVEGLRIELEESELMDNTQQTITKFTDENIITKLKKNKKNYKYIYVRLNVCNQSDEDKNIEALIYNFVMECMPSGWSNGASSEYLYYYKMSMKQFGGITGDLAGFHIQICELVIALSAVIGQIIGG